MSIEINLNVESLKKLEARSKEKGFDSLEKYVEEVLSQIASKIESSTEDSKTEEVKKRLKKLGYLE